MGFDGRQAAKAGPRGVTPGIGHLRHQADVGHGHLRPEAERPFVARNQRGEGGQHTPRGRFGGDASAASTGAPALWQRRGEGLVDTFA